MSNISQDDLIRVACGFHLKYSDLVERSINNKSGNKFFVNIWLKNGKNTKKWFCTSNEIFSEDEVRPYTLKFNPEKLI